MTWVLTTTNENFFQSYLQIMNGIAKLSKDEMAVLSSFMGKEDILSEFDVLALKTASGFTDRKFTIIFNTLLKKGLIVRDGEDFKINDRINVKRGTIQITFELRVV